VKQLKSRITAGVCAAALGGCAWFPQAGPSPAHGIARNGIDLDALAQFALKLRHSKHMTATSATITNGRVVLSAAAGDDVLALRIETRLHLRSARPVAALHHHTQ